MWTNPRRSPRRRCPRQPRMFTAQRPHAEIVCGLLWPPFFASAWRLLRGSYSGIAQRLRLSPKIRSLAVLPLRNLSGDPAQEYLADGITEALIGRLSNIHDLRVISHTSVMRFKESAALHTGDRQNTRRGRCRRRLCHERRRSHSRHGPADSRRNRRAFLVPNL